MSREGRLSLNFRDIPRGQIHTAGITKGVSRDRKICEEMMTKIYKLMQTTSPWIHNLSDMSIRNMKIGHPNTS